jgi:hypothetical protein
MPREYPQRRPIFINRERIRQVLAARADSSIHEVKLLCSFFDDAVGALKKLRGLHEQETKSPLNTPALEEVRRILAQLLLSASAVSRIHGPRMRELCIPQSCFLPLLFAV